LYVIGGDGSMRAAHALQRTADEMGKDLAVVGVPKTMDNDILWIWQSFGFLSAVEKAREVILNMHTEVSSNPAAGYYPAVWVGLGICSQPCCL
jgi:6-phosphofructokinase 1